MDYKKILMDKYISAIGTNDVTEDEIIERYNHSLGVRDALIKINNHFNLNLDENLLNQMGYFHDYAKFVTKDEYLEAIKRNKATELDKYVDCSPKIYHGILGYLIVKEELGIKDNKVLNAIKYHTVSSPNMDIYGEVLMCADFTEENRDADMFNTARKYLYESSDIKSIYKCIAYILKTKMRKSNLKGYPILDETKEAYEKYRMYLEEPLEKVKSVIRQIDHNLVSDVRVYDMRNRNPLVDYVIVATIDNIRQMDACISYIRQEFDLRSTEKGEYWTLIDMGDIIVHLFRKEERGQYNLDLILGDSIELEY